jgi:hypothetical protein
VKHKGAPAPGLSRTTMNWGRGGCNTFGKTGSITTLTNHLIHVTIALLLKKNPIIVFRYITFAQISLIEFFELNIVIKNILNILILINGKFN